MINFQLQKESKQKNQNNFFLLVPRNQKENQSNKQISHFKLNKPIGKLWKCIWMCDFCLIYPINAITYTTYV